VTLWDIDKHNLDRGSPDPNSHDNQHLDVVRRSAHGTHSINPQVVGIGGDSPILGGTAHLVKSGVIRVTTPDGTPGQITTTTTTVAHNLGYAPLAQAFMNNSQINGVGSFNLALPLITSFANNANGDVATEYLAIITHMRVSTDTENFYVFTYGSGIQVGTDFYVSYYLYRQEAQTS
jgi:hypothetical protein